MHHLTADELVLAGSAITAVSSAIVAVIVAHTGKRRDHVARLWERRAEAYESVLVEADWWREMRADMIRMSRQEKPSNEIVPSGLEYSDERRRLQARLEIYGERKVRQAYERSRQADLEVGKAYIAYYRTAHETANGAELERLGKAVESANVDADARQEELEEVVAKAVVRMPRYERRAWRRLKSLQA